MEKDEMEFINKILPTLWAIVEKRKCAVNISSIENKLTVNILLGKRRKTFCDKDENLLLQQLQNYLAA
jgi:hypothetical protein